GGRTRCHDRSGQPPGKKWEKSLRSVLRSLCAQVSCEPRTRADSELRVRPGEVRLNRLHRHEERGSDLLVRPAFGDELCDLPLRGCESAFRGRPPADSLHLGPRTPREGHSTQAVEDGGRFLERPACVGLAFRSSEGRPEREQGSRPVKGKRNRVVLRQCSPESVEGVVDSPVRRSEQSPTTPRCGEAAMAAQPSGVRLVPIQQPPPPLAPAASPARASSMSASTWSIT